MMKVLRTLTPSLVALCHLSAAQTQIPLTGHAHAKEKTDKTVAYSSKEKRAAKKAKSGEGITVPLSDASSTGAASVQKLQVTSQAFDRWKRIEEPLLSPNGAWAVYTLTNPSGGAELVARATSTSKEWRVARGKIENGRSRAQQRSSPPFSGRERPKIDASSRFVIFTEVADPRQDLHCWWSAGCVPKNTIRLGILSLGDGHVEKISNVVAFALSEGSGRHLAYALVTSATGADQMQRVSKTTKLDDTRIGSELNGSHRLVLRDLKTGSESLIEDVGVFQFDPTGRYLAYTISSDLAHVDGIYMRRLSDGLVSALTAGLGRYESLAFNNTGTRFAFVSDANELGKTHPRFSIYYSDYPMHAARVVLADHELPPQTHIARLPDLKFATRDDALVFGVTVSQNRDKESDRGVAQSPVLDLWHWNDQLIQPEQKAQAAAGEDISYTAVYDIARRRLTQVATPAHPHVSVTEDARYAIVVDQSPYMVQKTWGEFIADIYAVDIVSERHKLVRKGFRTSEWLPFAPLRMSPRGRFLLYFEDRRWFSYDFFKERLTDFTGSLLPFVHFETERSRLVRRPARPVGVAGWTQDESHVLLYDQRDIWMVDPTGILESRNLTNEVGKKMNIVFSLYPHSHWYREGGSQYPLKVNATKPLLLTAFNMDTQESGFWEVDLVEGASPEPLLMTDKQFELVDRIAGDAAQYLVTQQSVNEFPDLWAGKDFGTLDKISESNPHQSEYLWETVELITWVSDFGVPLRGLLYKPENFNRENKYPMIVNVHESFSDYRHTYDVPEPMNGATLRSAVPFVSKGYLVFKPEVLPVTPYPGRSVLASVEPGLRELVDRGFVDATRIGITGHSTGGYYVNYILTQTDVFRCACSGAGEVNLISNYSGIRAGGLVRSFQYEHGSAQIGSSIWEEPYRYIENSPLFFADRVQTPLLLLHNDKDGSVPFDQAREFYIALRRHRKPVYLLNYSGEDHNLRERSNIDDWNIRVHQFFDHCLMGAPIPEWMSRGVLYDEKIKSAFHR